MLLWVGCAVVLVWVIGRVWLALSVTFILVGLVLIMISALLLSAMVSQLTSSRAGVTENFVFWVVRCQLAIIPCLPAFVLGYRMRNPDGSSDLGLGLLTVVICGVILCDALTVVLLQLRERAEASAVRWLCAAGALLLACEIYWSSLAPRAALDLESIFLIGCAAGLIRPLSWLWQAPLSLGVALAARTGAPITTLRALHPATLDELSLLPLPGLPATLAHACAVDLEGGGDWLLDVAAHPGQSRAARAAIRMVLRRQYHAHPLLFWLSTCPEGTALLHRIAQHREPHGALIAAYATLATVESPDEWPYVIANHRAAFVTATELPGGAAMLALLDAGELVLRADRWPLALAGLRSAPVPSGVAEDPIWVALSIVRGWANDPQPAFAADQNQLIGIFLRELEGLEGWPVDLIAAIAEHLRYLIRVEQQRGALLV